MQTYSNQALKDDPNASPDIEVFLTDPKHHPYAVCDPLDGAMLPTGWYWWYLPPTPEVADLTIILGPFDSREEAIADAQKDVY